METKIAKYMTDPYSMQSNTWLKMDTPEYEETNTILSVKLQQPNTWLLWHGSSQMHEYWLYIVYKMSIQSNTWLKIQVVKCMTSVAWIESNTWLVIYIVYKCQYSQIYDWNQSNQIHDWCLRNNRITVKYKNRQINAWWLG